MTDVKNPYISHIITFMFENRSFDNVLGWLYDRDNVPANYIPKKKPADPIFRGLNFENLAELANTANYNGQAITIAPEYATRATNIPGFDPGEEYEHVNNQLYGSKAAPPSSTTPPTMKGFLADYIDKTARHSPDLGTIRQIMASYPSHNMPVLNTLAKKYAVCDEWFASVPSQTNTNRAFSLSGTSCGLVDNGYLTGTVTKAFLDNDKFKTNTLFNTLSDNGFDDWGVFWFEPYPPVLGDGKPYTRNIFPELENIPNIDQHFHKFDDPEDGFFARVKNGKLPKFTFIDPKWGGAVLRDEIFVMGNEMHPPSDITPAENLLQQVYDAVNDINHSTARNALITVLFDEHGGTFDHVPPPAPAIPPWGTGGTPPPGVTPQYKFGFDRYGVRVPAIFIHPYIEEKTILRSSNGRPFDHTSLPATVLTQFLPKLDRSKWNLGERTKNAPTFESVVAPGQARMDTAFAPQPPAALGSVVNYGDPVWLMHPNSSKYISFAYSGHTFYFPQLGDVGAEISFQAGNGPINDGGEVQIRTAEYLEPRYQKGPVSNFPGIRNTIGAFSFSTSGTRDLYYWTTIDQDPDILARETWIIKKSNNSGGPIHYGDDVNLISAYKDYKGQFIIPDGNYLTSTSNPQGNQGWRIIPAASNQTPTIDRIKRGDYVTVPTGGFINFAVGADTVSYQSLISFMRDGYAALENATWQGDRTSIPISGGGDIFLFRLKNAANFEIAKKAIRSIIIQEKSSANFMIRGMERFYDIDKVPGLPDRAWLGFDLRRRAEH